VNPPMKSIPWVWLTPIKLDALVWTHINEINFIGVGLPNETNCIGVG
jgi:hypothetical protein